jgi:predicted nucleic acid-binding protein
MTREDLPDGARVFVEANILIDHCSGISVACRAFLPRGESTQVDACTEGHLLLEVTPRLMVLEALPKGWSTGGQPARKLKAQPASIKGVPAYTRAVQQIPHRGIRVRPRTSALVRAREAIRVQEGVMTNESVTVALMRTRGRTAVATCDADLDHVSPLSVYQPGDIPSRQQ